MNSQPLFAAAQKAVHILDAKPPPLDVWPVAGLLYAGAVLQLFERSPNDYHSGPDTHLERFDYSAPRPLGAHGILRSVADLVVTCNHAEECSNMARSIIKHLGLAVWKRINWLLKGNDDIAEGLFHPDIEGEINNRIHYRLVPAFMGGGIDQEETSLKRIFNHLPDDGWIVNHTKVLPRYVRVLSAPFKNGFEHIKIVYLESVDPSANEMLAEKRNPQGLTLASIPLHPSLKMQMEILKESRDGKIFRLNEPDQWPRGFRTHLRECLMACRDHDVSLVVLPELFGAPTVINYCREFLMQKELAFPVLLASGSWHVPTGGNGQFRNRLKIFSNTAPAGMTRICHHDKFSQFNSSFVLNGQESTLIEGNQPGEKSYTYLVTAIGIFAFGICRDWFHDAQSDDGTKAVSHLSHMAPLIHVAPSMTPQAIELKDSVISKYRRNRSIFLFSNACGQMRSHKIASGKNHWCEDNDSTCIRSFVAAPDNWFHVDPIQGVSLPRERPPVTFVKAACSKDCPLENMVIAGIRLKQPSLGQMDTGKNQEHPIKGIGGPLP